MGVEEDHPRQFMPFMDGFELVCDAAWCRTGRGRSLNVLPKLWHRNLGN